jgi:hypothetical protein
MLPPQGLLPTLDAWSKSLDSAADAYAREVEEAVRRVLDSPPNFDEGWRLVCGEVLAGKADEVQAARDPFLRLFHAHLANLEEWREVVSRAGRRVGHELGVAARLKAEVEALEGKLGRLEARWRTAEDLDDLAAESIPLPEAKLEAVRQKYGYPQAWYDQDSKPF